MYLSIFWTAKYERKSCLNWMVSLQAILNWFFSPKPGFKKFQWQKSLKNQYLPHSESKSYQINSIKFCSSRSFQTTPKAHSNSSKIFKYNFNLIFSEEIIQYSRTFASQVQMSWNQAHAPLLVESFPKTPRTWGSVDLIITEQNKLPSFIDRLCQLLLPLMFGRVG